MTMQHNTEVYLCPVCLGGRYIKKILKRKAGQSTLEAILDQLIATQSSYGEFCDSSECSYRIQTDIGSCVKFYIDDTPRTATVNGTMTELW